MYTRSINLDFANQQLPEHISVMQGDSARKILVELYRNNVEWEVPGDVSAYIAFRRPDGKNLKITSLSDGSPVVSLYDNMATISVPVEVTAMHGAVPLVVVFVDSNGSQIATFPIAISVVENPAVESDLASQLTPKEFDQLLVEITKTNARINELVASHDSDGAEEYSIDIYGDGNAYITIRSNGTTAVCTVSDNAIFGMGAVRKYQLPERFAPPIAYYEYDGDVELCISDSYSGYTEVVLKNKNQSEAKADGIWFQFVYALAAVYTPKELLDVRVGADGTIYETAGEAVREQMKAASTGSGGGDANVGAVLYTKQTLTPEQQEQARENIGAAALGEGGGGSGKPGTDGFSPIANVTQTDSGAVISITDKSGTTTATIVNGKDGAKGDKGDPGDKGDKGDTGAAGVSVSSVKQTTTSSADGGSNVVTVTLSNGTTSTFTVKNGSKGSAGAAGTNGKDGKTPVRGTDYWTEADKASMIQDVIDALGGTPIFGVVDASNNIILTGNLAEGTYTLKYEDADGNVTEIGTLDYSNTPEPTYTNLFVPGTATLNTRMSGGSKAPKTENGYVMTALIPIPLTAVTGGSTTSENFVVVPAAMWTGSANMFLSYGSDITTGYVDAGTTKGTVVGNWVKIPLVNQYSNSFNCSGVTISLKVGGSSLTASDIQNIEIYFNEIPE